MHTITSPYRSELVDDDDEVLVILAEELGGLTKIMPDTESARAIMKPLEALAMCEEAVVRDKVPFHLFFTHSPRF
jgi:serine/threonine-protein phosphatase 2A regulatory subunit A